MVKSKSAMVLTNNTKVYWEHLRLDKDLKGGAPPLYKLFKFHSLSARTIFVIVIKIILEALE